MKWSISDKKQCYLNQGLKPVKKPVISQNFPKIVHHYFKPIFIPGGRDDISDDIKRYNNI